MDLIPFLSKYVFVKQIGEAYSVCWEGRAQPGSEVSLPSPCRWQESGAEGWEFRVPKSLGV